MGEGDVWTLRLRGIPADSCHGIDGYTVSRLQIETYEDANSVRGTKTKPNIPSLSLRPNQIVILSELRPHSRIGVEGSTHSNSFAIRKPARTSPTRPYPQIIERTSFRR